MMPAATLVLALAYVLLRMKESKRYAIRETVLAGAIVGAAALVRPSSLSLLPTLLVPGWRSRRRLIAIAAGGIMTLAVVLAWVVEAHRIFGQWIPVNYANTRNFWLGNNPWTPLYKTWIFGSHEAGPMIPDDYLRFDREILELPVETRDAHYRHAAWTYVRARPDLFLLRTFNRARCYFAFETATGTTLITYFGAPKIAGLAFIVGDMLFYLPILFGTILFLLLPSTTADRSIPILAVALGYALPYWLAFSHPSYHFPIIPLGMACTAALAAKLGAGEVSWRRDVLPIVRSPRGAILLLVAAYIQVEWVVVMFDRVAAVS